METRVRAFEVFENWWNAVRMEVKMWSYIFVSLSILYLAVFVSWGYYSYTWEHISLLMKYFQASVFGNLFSIEVLSQRYKGTDAITILKPFCDAFLSDISRKLLICSLIYLLFPVIMFFIKRKAKEQSKPKFVRGARLITVKELVKSIKKDGEKTDIPVGKIRLPVSAEVKHAFLIGRPGVGKTVFMSQVIERLKERGERGIVYDFKGDYLCKFYNPDTDIIFNPLDTRGIVWNLFNEIKSDMDVDAVSHSLIPPPYTGDPFWNTAARDVFTGGLHYLIQHAKMSNDVIWKFVTSPIKDVAKSLKETKGGEAGYTHIQDVGSKQALGVIAVMMQYVSCFKYMVSGDSGFGIQSWLNDDSKGRWIFVTNYADVQDTLKPILSLFVDLLGRKLLSMNDDYDRRRFFLLDEFGTLNRLSTITRLLTLSRSKGGSCWIGIQDIGQMDKIYTPSIRQSIVNACGTNAIFSVADPDTAKFLSDKIGETEYIEMEKTQSMGVKDNRDGISLSQRKRLEKLILPSQIIGLRDLDFYLRIPNYSIAENRVVFKKYPDRHDRFVMRSELSLERIMTEQREVMRKAQEITGGNKERGEKREAEMDGLSRELKEVKQEEERIIEDELYY